jgi:hypothetical protein
MPGVAEVVPGSWSRVRPFTRRWGTRRERRGLARGLRVCRATVGVTDSRPRAGCAVGWGPSPVSPRWCCASAMSPEPCGRRTSSGSPPPVCRGRRAPVPAAGRGGPGGPRGRGGVGERWGRARFRPLALRPRGAGQAARAVRTASGAATQRTAGVPPLTRTPGQGNGRDEGRATEPSDRPQHGPAGPADAPGDARPRLSDKARALADELESRAPADTRTNRRGRRGRRGR